MATNKTYFMSVDYLRDETVINGNVDGEVLEPYILVAQNLHIEKILGTNLYDKIVSDLSGTISGNYKKLLDDYIHPALLQWSLYECLPFVNYKFTNKAITTSSSDNSESIELTELQYLRQSVRDVAEYYSQRVIDYIKDNESLFPEYTSNGDNCSDISASSSSYFSGIQF
jgi:hypothetical protein